MSGQHRLVVPDASGHSELAFDPSDQTALAGILARYNLEVTKPGRRAFATEQPGGTLLPVDGFDPKRFEHFILPNFEGG